MWTRTAERSGSTPMSFTSLDGPDSGLGTRFCFCPGDLKNDSVVDFFSSLTSGYGEIVESVENERVAIDIDWGFMRGLRIISVREISAQEVEVQWQETFIINNPALRYLPIFLNEIDFSPALRSAEEMTR